MTTAEPWTIGRLLQWTTDYLKAHGSDTPRLDAEILLAESLSCRRIDLYTRYEETPAEQQRARFRDMVRRRAEGMPVAYLVGRREFYSLSFRVSTDVLIPRPETELLVMTLLDLAKDLPAGQPIRIADVGTGSGIIAVSAAKHLPAARVTAIDSSPAALAVARANAADHGVTDRVDFLQSDLLEAVPAEERFDFIASNPPYVSTSELEQLDRSVKDFEPRQALVAGPRGTEVIERLLPQAAERLAPGGHLLIEISPMIHDAVQALIVGQQGLDPGPTIKDLARLPRVVQAGRKGQRGKGAEAQSE